LLLFTDIQIKLEDEDDLKGKLIIDNFTEDYSDVIVKNDVYMGLGHDGKDPNVLASSEPSSTEPASSELASLEPASSELSSSSTSMPVASSFVPVCAICNDNATGKHHEKHNLYECSNRG